MDPWLQSQVVWTVQTQILQLCLMGGGRKEEERGGREGGRKEEERGEREGGEEEREGRGEKGRRKEGKGEEGEEGKLKASWSTQNKPQLRCLSAIH